MAARLGRIVLRRGAGRRPGVRTGRDQGIKVRALIGRGPAQQFRGGKTLRCERNKGCHGGFLGRDRLIEVSEMGYVPLVEQDVRCSDVSVDNAAPMDVSKRPAQLPGCAEEVSERYL